MRILLTVLCLLATTACDEGSPSGPTVPLSQEFTLAPGESALIADTGVRVLFLGVTSDSRCPADAICIQLGDAVVRVRLVGAGNATEYDLHTDPSRETSVVHQRLRVRLVQLQPYPFSGRTIGAADYRATLTVAAG